MASTSAENLAKGTADPAQARPLVDALDKGKERGATSSLLAPDTPFLPVRKLEFGEAPDAPAKPAGDGKITPFVPLPVGLTELIAPTPSPASGHPSTVFSPVPLQSRLAKPRPADMPFFAPDSETNYTESFPEFVDRYAGAVISLVSGAWNDESKIGLLHNVRGSAVSVLGLHGYSLAAFEALRATYPFRPEAAKRILMQPHREACCPCTSLLYFYI